MVVVASDMFKILPKQKRVSAAACFVARESARFFNLLPLPESGNGIMLSGSASVNDYFIRRKGN